MENWKAISGIGTAILILAMTLSYLITEDTFYCENEPEKLLECPWGISGGMGTRCYLNEELNKWDYCNTGWIKATDHLEKIDHRIYDNETCTIIRGDTSTLSIC